MTPTIRSVLLHSVLFAALALFGLALWQPRAVAIMIDTAGRFCF